MMPDLEVQFDHHDVTDLRTGRVLRREVTSEYRVTSRHYLHNLIDEILNDKSTGEVRFGCNRGGVGFLIFTQRDSEPPTPLADALEAGRAVVGSKKA